MLPIINQIEIIYSCDKHLKSEYFQKMKVPIQNPLDIWLDL